MKYKTAAWIVATYAALWLGFWGMVVWAAIHFISKHW